MENDENLQPDIMLGDFDLMKNPEIDHLNNRRGVDPMVAKDATSEPTTKLNQLTDSWRQRNPRSEDTPSLQVVNQA